MAKITGQLTAALVEPPSVRYEYEIQGQPPPAAGHLRKRPDGLPETWNSPVPVRVGDRIEISFSTPRSEPVVVTVGEIWHRVGAGGTSDKPILFVW